MQALKVGGVLESSGPRLDDGYRDFLKLMHLRLSNSRRTESLILNGAQCRCEAAHLAEDLGELLQQVRPVLAPGLGVDQHQEGDAELRHDAACHASRVTTPRVTCDVYHRPECLTTITAPASSVLEAASLLSALSLR